MNNKDKKTFTATEFYSEVEKAFFNGIFLGTLIQTHMAALIANASEEEQEDLVQKACSMFHRVIDRDYLVSIVLPRVPEYIQEMVENNLDIEQLEQSNNIWSLFNVSNMTS